jgi:calcineurin-like phosphoesterase family protein
MKYFTSDLHFNHSSILQYCRDSRDFSTIEEMNEAVIKSINDHTTPKDELYILGDVLMGQRKEGFDLIRRLNPRLHLIRGNHDHFKPHEEEEFFESAQDYLVVKENKKQVICFHFPIEQWDKCHYGIIHLHGHCHGDLERELPNRFDIGWDVYQRPVSMEEVVSWKVEDRVTHHGEVK